MVGGVAPTATRFAQFLCKKHKVYPKDLWKTQIVTLGSVPGINTRYRPALHALYGKVTIREIYGAKECMFGQQRDEKKAWVPKYDLFFPWHPRHCASGQVCPPGHVFEVETRSGFKMLHEMRPGEMGSMIVSTPALVRYKIGDLIRAFRTPYFRCIGRDTWWTPLRYAWDEFRTFNLGRL